MRKKKSEHNLLWLPVTFLAVFAVFGLFAWISSGSRKGEPEKDGLSYVSMEEERDPREVQAKINEAKTEAPTDEEPTNQENETQGEATDPTAPVENPSQEILTGLQAEIDSLNPRALSETELAALRAKLTDTVVIGDSMAQAVLEYGLLDANHVFYKRSASISDLSAEVNRAMSMLPKNVIFFTGLNDTDRFTDTKEFAAAYRQKIEQVLSIDPTVHVYVCTMTPPSNPLGAARPDLARAPLYDQELQQLPNTTRAKYLDLNWMVRQQLYLGDGIHFNAGFYSVWLRYVALKIAD